MLLASGFKIGDEAVLMISGSSGFVMRIGVMGELSRLGLFTMMPLGCSITGGRSERVVN